MESEYKLHIKFCSNHHSQPKIGEEARGIQWSCFTSRRPGYHNWRNWERGHWRWGRSHWRNKEHVDVNLLSSLAMAWDPTQKVVVAASGNSDRVIPRRVSGDRGRRIAWLVRGICYLHHIVVHWIIRKNWSQHHANIYCQMLIGQTWEKIKSKKLKKLRCIHSHFGMYF